jgi:integrase/recombinase XerD
VVISPTLQSSNGAIAPRADHDAELIALWLHGRPVQTRRAYAGDVARFRAFVGKPLARVTLGEVQAYADGLAALAAATQERQLSAVKSLLAFGHRIGVLPADVGAPVRLPARRDTLAERIVDEAAVHRMLALEPDRRNRVLLRLAYAAGLRVSELVGLRWRDLVERGEARQVTVLGKGGKTRTVLLSARTWQELTPLRGDAGPDAPVFRSRRGGHLDPAQAWRIVRAAAVRAGLDAPVSPHWLRHAHASHALDRGAPSTWSPRPSGTPRSPRRDGTPTRGRPTPARATSLSDVTDEPPRRRRPGTPWWFPGWPSLRDVTTTAIAAAVLGYTGAVLYPWLTSPAADAMQRAQGIAALLLPIVTAVIGYYFGSSAGEKVARAAEERAEEAVEEKSTVKEISDQVLAEVKPAVDDALDFIRRMVAAEQAEAEEEQDGEDGEDAGQRVGNQPRPEEDSDPGRPGLREEGRP